MNLLDMARQEIATRAKWHNGQTVTIWQSSTGQAWLKNDSGWLKLTVFKDAARMTDRKYSQPLPVGYYDPLHGLWVENANVFELYPAWAQQTRRIMGV